MREREKERKEERHGKKRSTGVQLEHHSRGSPREAFLVSDVE